MAKIKEAREQLAVLSEKLDTQKVILEKKTKECDELVQTIETSTETANTKKASAEVAAKEIEKQSKVIAVEKVSHTSIKKSNLPFWTFIYFSNFPSDQRVQNICRNLARWCIVLPFIFQDSCKNWILPARTLQDFEFLQES